MSRVEVCGGCRFWCGRCLKGKHALLANSGACELFMVREAKKL